MAWLNSLFAIGFNGVGIEKMKFDRTSDDIDRR